MDFSQKYCFYLGTLRGILQCTSCKSDEKVHYTIPEKQSEITALEWGRFKDEIIIGYKNEQVHLYSSSESRYTKTINKLEGEGSIVGVAPLDKSIIVAKQDGIITIWNDKQSDFFSINLQQEGTLDTIVYNKARPEVVGTGGEYNDFKLWQVETKQCLFRAKSLGHDELNLPIPTSIRGITFLQENEKLNVCATREGYVLLYDERVQRRPVVKFYEKKASYTCIASTWRERQCLVGTTRGYMQLLDLRVPGKCSKTFTSFTGSVTSIVCDPFEPFVASSSLDRFLRIHNLETKDVVHKIYLKQNLTRILLKPLVKKERPDDQDQVFETQDKEYEELFDNMEKVIETAVSERKRKLKFKHISKRKKKVTAI